MEEIVRELQKISGILLQNQSPVWLTYLSALGPLILTGISVFIACRQHCQNQKLQKQIADRDASNLLRQNVLDIYNAYFNVLIVVTRADNVSGIFSAQQTMIQWMTDFQKAYDSLACSYNHAKLMLDDAQLLQVLNESFRRLNNLYNSVAQYSHSNLPVNVIHDAWAVISPKYAIQINNYDALSQNHIAMEEFWKLCDNRHTQEIRRLMEDFRASMSDENFDKYFKKYIQIKQL